MSAAAAATKRLVVCGGNGFLGSRICKAAVSRGWDVTSIRYELPIFPTSKTYLQIWNTYFQNKTRQYIFM